MSPSWFHWMGPKPNDKRLDQKRNGREAQRQRWSNASEDCPQYQEQARDDSFPRASGGVTALQNL